MFVILDERRRRHSCSIVKTDHQSFLVRLPVCHCDEFFQFAVFAAAVKLTQNKQAELIKTSFLPQTVLKRVYNIISDGLHFSLMVQNEHFRATRIYNIFRLKQ